MEKKKERESNIELLKIVAIFFIIISHVINSIFNKKIGLFYAVATNDIKVSGLFLLYHLGCLGNLIFVICSAWFLVDSKKTYKKKFISIWANTFIISVLFLFAYLFLKKDFSNKIILKCLLPVSSLNNWFIAIYLFYLLIIPYLNTLINKMDQKQLFRVTFFLLILCFGICFIKTIFEINEIFYFITIHFIVAYIKKYMLEFWNDKKNCILFLTIGIIGNIIICALLNYLGTKIDFFRYKMIMDVKNNNPFILITAISFFNLFRRINFKNRFINNISSLSLYIYLFHENILFESLTTPIILSKIFEKFGCDYIYLEVFLYSLILFIVAAIISYFYKLTIGKGVFYIVNKLGNDKDIRRFYNKIEKKILGDSEELNAKELDTKIKTTIK